MDLSSLLPKIRGLPALESRAGRFRLQLPSAARPPVAAALARRHSGPALVISSRADRVLTLSQELLHWAPHAEIVTFPEPDPLFYERLPWGTRTRQRRAAVLAKLTEAPSGGSLLLLASARAIMARTLSPDQFLTNSRSLRPGQSFEMHEFLEFLVNAGYEPEGIVTERGQFSRRGGILDVWPTARDVPVRLELFGDQLDSMREFDPGTQRSTDGTKNLQLTPAREGLPSLLSGLPDHELDLSEYYLPWIDPAASILDYLPDNSLVLFEDHFAFEGTIDELEARALQTREQSIQDGGLPPDTPRPYLTIDELEDSLARVNAVDLGLSGEAPEETVPDFVPGQRFGGQIKPFMSYLVDRRLAHETCVIVSRQASRLADLWTEQDGGRNLIDRAPGELEPGAIYFLQGALTEGWVYRGSGGHKLHLLTDAEIFGWSRPKPRRRIQQRVPAPEAAYADLSRGDHVVHVDYGIGQFEGLVERTLDDLEREYLLISYAEGDQLYVPIHQADRITSYVGVDNASPKLSRLGSQRWTRTRAEARRAVEEIARDLLELYAKRMSVVGHSFAADSAWQQELEASFPYIETDDQISALEAVKADMERSRPMDRLICGDVGYGKTEVALRAAFKAVMDGRQVGVLVPTTVLAQQHYRTFRRRLAAFPVVVEMLSRFRTRAETVEILQRLREGQLDIVIGTHRMLQRDVEFQDLGLLIIDEEQRFGVTHKEYLKAMRTEVDVLTLTATPIPRTLYLALTGIRDISTIDTAPEDRLPIVTHTGPYDPALIRQAVLREIDRGGQVFFVHNRVQSIVSVEQRIRRLVPEARVEIAHGQMPERDLADVMSRFTDGEVDVLLSTSIIESGLDIPNANTLIVDRADQFGLAQMYQLRGRVGRGAVRAYAYFFQHSGARATAEARQRLDIISENSQLGAGYSIALRDLEMRGAGDLLGKRQHGQIAAIGFHLYTQLLAEAVRRMRDQKPEARAPDLPAEALPVQVSLELPLASALTADYVPDRALRLQLYRRMAGLRSREEIEAMRTELIDRFGAPPSEVHNLLYQLHLKVLVTQAEVLSVSTEAGQILIQLGSDRRPEDYDWLGPDTRFSKRGLWLTSDDWQTRLPELLEALAAEPVPA